MSKQGKNKDVISRPPIIVVMGHIDHGKSQLLDYIRKSNVVAGEAGGITQHMYAYEIEHTDTSGMTKTMTFLDTPGHEAFTLMRSRGAEVADIAILVVAADDGVKQQTVEAINIIKESGIPYVVAINKTDLPNADVEKIKQQLAEKEVFLEGYGGNVSHVALSAKTGAGVPELLELISLTADVEEFTGDPTLPAQGVVIESHRDPQKGISATLLIHNGTLKTGSYVAAGGAYTPVRRIETFLGEAVPEARFSSPVRISGFNEMPSVGSSFTAHSSKKEAQQALLEQTKLTQETAPLASDKNERSEEDEHGYVTVPIIVKADMEGTLEAVLYEIEKVSVPHVIVSVVDSGVGAVSESDVKRAGGVGETLIIGFNVSVEKSAHTLAQQLEIPIETFTIIYRLTEWLEEELAKRKPKIQTEESLGKAKIIRVFSKTNKGQVVGGKVREGRLKKGSQVKILRRDIEIARGKIIELQQQKVKTDEVLEGQEFGAMIESKEHDIAEGDYIENFVLSDV